MLIKSYCSGFYFFILIMSLSSFITMIMWHHKMNWKMFSYISRRIGIEFLLFLPQISLRLWWWWFFFYTEYLIKLGHAAAKSLQSCLTVRPHRWQPTRLPHPWDSLGKNTGVGCHFLLQCIKVKSESEVAQSCPTLGDPMDCSPPGSSIHGIFQARVLEWGAIAFSEIGT